MVHTKEGLKIHVPDCGDYALDYAISPIAAICFNCPTPKKKCIGTCLYYREKSKEIREKEGIKRNGLQ